MNTLLKTQNYKIEYNEALASDGISWENHCHPNYEIIAVIDGAINVVYEGKNFRCEKGELLLASPLTYHSVGADANSDYRRIVASFDTPILPASLNEKLLSLVSACPVFSSKRVFDCVLELRKLLMSQNPGLYVPLAEALMVQLIYRCIEEERDISEIISNDIQHRLLRDAVAYIDLHITEKIMLDDVAVHLFISKSTLSHLFTDQMQISPKQYILQKKIAYAKKLIGEGYRITEAARAVGYENYSNFYRILKKQK